MVRGVIDPPSLTKLPVGGRVMFPAVRNSEEERSGGMELDGLQHDGSDSDGGRGPSVRVLMKREKNKLLATPRVSSCKR